MPTQSIANLVKYLPEFPVSTRTCPRGSLGMLCDEDAEIVLTERYAYSVQAVVATLVRYSPDGGVAHREELGRYPTTFQPHFAAHLIRRRFQTVLRQEQETAREHCAAARKTSRR